MHYVSLIIEFLRGRPTVVFWTAALTQALLWTLVPALFYSAPPGEVPMVLAIGHEFMLGSYLGPPLAFWLGEIAFRIAGSLGLYALAQACIVTAYWAVFTLGRAIVGTKHAVLAVLLMVGIAAFTVPSPDFGPAVLAAPLWALALLHYWRAAGEDKRGSWFLLALFLGLLLLSNYVGIILVALMIVFTLATARGRRALLLPEPWIAGLLLVIVVFPHAAWLETASSLVISGIGDSSATPGTWPPGVWLCLTLLANHLGLVLMVAIASGWLQYRRRWRDRAPEIDRNPVEPSGRRFVYFFALGPAACAIAIVFGSGLLGPLDRVAPLVLLSGLAVVVAGGDEILLYRERLLSSAWLGLLVLPPALVVLALFVLPWISGTDLKIAQPVMTEGQFFGDNFQRRSGKPLAYVTGDSKLAPLVALGAPSRPHVYFAWAPLRSPWATAGDVVNNGGMIVWPADNTGAPHPTLKAQFPAMVPEVPRSFARSIQGILPLIKVGWAVLRPQ